MYKFDPQQYADDEVERVTLRMPHKSKEQLATIAQNNNVSLNVYILRCINYATKMSA